MKTFIIDSAYYRLLRYVNFKQIYNITLYKTHLSNQKQEYTVDLNTFNSAHHYRLTNVKIL
jgi:hypothetical protein